MFKLKFLQVLCQFEIQQRDFQYCLPFILLLNTNNFSMDAKYIQSTIQKPIIGRRILGNTVHKQSSCLPEHKLQNFKKHQTIEKIPSPETINSTIDLIQKLSLAIKQIKIALFIQNSLINSLNIYSDYLRKNLNNHSKFIIIPQINNKIKKTLENVNQNLYGDNKFQNSRRLMTELSKNQNAKTGKITQKQKKEIPMKLKQNHRKIILPQITKDKSINSQQLGSAKDKPQEKNNQIIESQDKNISIHQTIEIKSLNKSPKSRFFQLKNSYDCVQQDQSLEKDSQSVIFPVLKSIGQDFLSEDKQNRKKQNEILQELKKRLIKHIKMIEKLENKIEEFQTKKMGHFTRKVFKNEIQDYQLKLNLIQTEINSKNTLNQNSKQVQILKKQLQQRQTELKNIWQLLLQQQSFGSFSLQ